MRKYINLFETTRSNGKLYKCFATHVIWMALIDLPRKSADKFWHPESTDLILTAAAMTTVFSFWNAINIRPSMLTDPGYQEQRVGIERNMKISLGVILGICAGFGLVYGRKGWIPAAAAAGTGVAMYLWTDSELKRNDPAETIDGSGSLYQDTFEPTDADASSLMTVVPEIQSVLFQPMSVDSTAISGKKRKESVGMN
jgi:hypothetical protein